MTSSRELIEQGPSSGDASSSGSELADAALPGRDVRRKRPALLRFLLQAETLRRLARVISLLVLDFVGVAGALFTALILKAAVRGHASASVAWAETRHWLPFAYLVTVLLFAKADLYADRPRRPGLTRIASTLFQVTVI